MTMKLSIICIVLLLLLTQLFGGWLVLNPPMVDTGYGGYADETFSFITPDTGFFTRVTFSGVHLWKTTDGCQSFQNVIPQEVDTVGWLVSCQFFNELGYLYEITSIAEAKLWKTTDLGNSWECVLSVQVSPRSWVFPRLCFLNPNYGYLAVMKSPGLYKTSDGGNTWSSFALPCTMLFNICFTDTLTGYILGRERYEDDFGKVWKTTDGGANWEIIYSPNIDFYQSHIQFLSRDTGYISDDDEGEGVILKTTDGGNSWVEIFTAYGIRDMFFVSNDIGFVVTFNSSPYVSIDKLHKTSNGRDFYRVALPLSRISYINEIHFVKGTLTGYVYCRVPNVGSKILKTVDGGGESLGFWQPLTTMPDKPNKGALLTAYPYSNSLFLQEIGKEYRLWSYDINKDSWYAKRPFSEKLKQGASITSNEDGLFVLSGKSNQCFNYNPEDNTWLKLPDILGDNVVKNGGCITTDAEGNLYVLKGGKTNEFYAFNKESNQWQKKPDIPGSYITKGASIACDNEYVYAIKGGKTNEFWSYSITGDSWHRLTDIISKGFKDGSRLAANPYIDEGNGVLTLKGGGQECWYYGSYWKLIPGIPGRKKIKKGAQLTVDENNVFYAIKNNRMTQIWQTDEFLAVTGYKPIKISDNIQTEERIAESQAENKTYISNPVKSVLNIHCPESVKEFKIFDVSGKLVKEIATSASQSRNDGMGETKISLKGINPGIYFLRFGTETKKFLVVK